MRLSAFIIENKELILQEWEDFAETLHPLVGSTRHKLRDHAQQMLMVICADLDTYQCEQESIEKSKGKAPSEASDTAAESHAGSNKPLGHVSIIAQHGPEQQGRTRNQTPEAS